MEQHNTISQYDFQLALFYGNVDRLISNLEDRILKYKDAPKTKKVIERINNLESLLKYTIMSNDKSIHDHLRSSKYCKK